MNITKITGESELPIKTIKRFTQEELKNEYNYYLAQRLTKKLLEKELISVDEFNKTTASNRKTFSPYLAEIMP